MIELTVLNDSNVELNTVDDGLIGLDVVMATGGGSEINNQNKTVTPTESEQSVTADAGYTGLGTVTVEGIDSDYVGSGITRRTGDDLTAVAFNVIVPKGYYESNATKSVAKVEQGIPVATKGNVSNHSVSVTPEVTNVTGWITNTPTAQNPTGTVYGTPVSVSASELVSGTKSISANGTEDVTNYASVSVAVPNSYSASDEGKVVDNGALVSQTSDTVTANDTYDTTLINSLTVNVSGSEDFLAKRAGNTLVDYTSTEITSISTTYLFYGCTSLKTVTLPNLTRIADNTFYGCSALETLNAPYRIDVGATAFRNCTKLTYFCHNVAGIYTDCFRGCTSLLGVDLGTQMANTRNYIFEGATKLKKVVIRRTAAVCPLQNTNAFDNTPFKSGGTGGTLYVPSALVSSYQSASNWSTILGRTNNQIKSIESTATDPNEPLDLTTYLLDGTLLPT